LLDDLAEFPKNVKRFRLVHYINVLKLAELLRRAVGVICEWLICEINVLNGMRRRIHPEAVHAIFQPKSQNILKKKPAYYPKITVIYQQFKLLSFPAKPADCGSRGQAVQQ
jgi:hypothetical protein